MKVKYVSERIVNIKEMETYIQNADLYFGLLVSEMKKEAPCIGKIHEAEQIVKRNLEKAMNFEFRIEQRVCHITDADDSQ